MSETVTCIIPVRNGATTIERAIESAIDAGCDSVMACDDSSSDNTFDVIVALKQKYSELDVSFTGSIYCHAGVNFARNFMIGRISHSLIICLDADDELRDINPLLDAWQEGTWVYGNHAEVINEAAKAIVKGSPAGSLPRKELTGITFMFHKSDWLKCGGFDPDFAYAEDYAFQCNLTHHGVTPKYVDTVVYNRYLKAEGNERSALAGEYWQHYHTMARRKYPSIFAGIRS